jgi:Flp pilus assembly protein TadG
MATALFGLLALVFLGAMVGVIAGTISVHDLKELSSFVTPLVVLVSTVTAFYFGGRVAK